MRGHQSAQHATYKKSIRTILVKHTGANTLPQNLWFYNFVQPQNYRGAESMLPGFELVVPGRLRIQPRYSKQGGRKGVEQAEQTGRSISALYLTPACLLLLHNLPSVTQTPFNIMGQIQLWLLVLTSLCWISKAKACPKRVAGVFLILREIQIWYKGGLCHLLQTQTQETLQDADCARPKALPETG